MKVFGVDFGSLC